MRILAFAHANWDVDLPPPSREPPRPSVRPFRSTGGARSSCVRGSSRPRPPDSEPSREKHSIADGLSQTSRDIGDSFEKSLSGQRRFTSPVRLATQARFETTGTSESMSQAGVFFGRNSSTSPLESASRPAPADLSQRRWEDQTPGANRVGENETQMLVLLPMVGVDAIAMCASGGDR